jgi:hypothetical protein
VRWYRQALILRVNWIPLKEKSLEEGQARKVYKGWGDQRGRGIELRSHSP